MSYSPSSGGSSAVDLPRTFYDTAGTYANSTNASWTELVDPATGLLDLTDPTHPVVLRGGVYAFTCALFPVAQAGKFAGVAIILDDNADISAEADSPFVDITSATFARVSASATYYLPVGAVVRLKVRTDATDVTFTLGQIAVQVLALDAT